MTSAPPCRPRSDGSDVDDRAQVFELTKRMVHGSREVPRPGDEGLDGADGPERRGLNPVMNAVLEYVDEQRARKFELT